MVRQQGLFEQQPTLNVLRDLKVAMAIDAEASGLSREELCNRINLLGERYGMRLVKGSGVSLTMATLEKWLNPEDRERVIPSKGLTTFCSVTNGIGTMQTLVAPLGWLVLDAKEALVYRRAKIKEEIEEKKAELRSLDALYRGRI